MRGARTALFLLGTLLAASARPAPGPLVGWGSGGETGLRWDAGEGRSTSQPLVRESELHGWVGVSLAGQLVDSRWLAWSWNMRPGFVRSGGNQPGASLQTSEFAHQLTASSQPWPWLRTQVSADRDRIVANRGEEALRESRFAHAEARAEVRASVFTLGTLGRRERFDDRWMSTTLSPELERHVDRRAFEVWLESSKLRLADRLTLELDPSTGAEVRTRRTTVDHTLRWGRGSRLASSLEWNGQSPRAVTVVDRAIQEQLHLRHTHWLSSDYRFQATHALLSSGESMNRSHFAELAARTDGVGVSLAGGVRSDQSPGREGHAASLGPRATWQRGWSSGLRLSADAGASFENERRTGANDARVAVSNESHTVAATRQFALALEGVDSVTVEVRDAGGVAGFIEGVDWGQVRSGTLTFVVIPLGSRIAVGDVVLVTYEATPPGVPSRHSARTDLTLSTDWRGLSLRLSDWQVVARDEPGDRGAASLGRREQSATLTAGIPRGPARLDLSASGRRRVVEGQTARVQDAHAGLSWRLSPAWLAAADVAASNSSESGGRLGSALQRASILWNAGGAWRWGAHAERVRFDRTAVPVVTQRLAGADATARWGLLDASFRVDVGVRDGDPGHHFRRFSLALLRRLR